MKLVLPFRINAGSGVRFFVNTSLSSHNRVYIQTAETVLLCLEVSACSRRTVKADFILHVSPRDSMRLFDPQTVEMFPS